MDTVGISSRFLALVCDQVALFGVVVFVAFAAAIAGHASAVTDVAHPYLTWIGLTLAYFIVLETAAGGTAGKLILGMRVVNESGGRITLAQSIVRNLVRFVDLLFFGLVGAASMAASDQDQRLGDRVAHTYVVRYHRQLVASAPY